jgi:mono/diheme cytochrome c family protein
MKQVLFLAVFAAMALTGVYGVITLYDSTLKVGRMNQTPVVRPHEEPQLIMDNRTIALGKSEALIKESLINTKTNKIWINALPGTPTDPENVAVARGEKEYNAFCSHCHGPKLDGLGTVGQSFFPLPMNLLGEKAVGLSDKEIFIVISYGSNKTPALASSMSVESRKAAIQYIRFMQKTAR